MFQMKTPKTLERHIWIIDINAAFQEILIYLMFDPRFSRFSPSGSCHLGRWPPAGRAACLPPSGPEGLSRPHVQVHCVDPMCKLNPPPPESSQRHLLYASGILRYFFFFLNGYAILLTLKISLSNNAGMPYVQTLEIRTALRVQCIKHGIIC